ncbi:hypothetical protein [Caballeronia sp. LZ035]|uniref:hypothetical protein n=1 Tax=Caballeronia sp. LZ035 TaxID=3038568 RepID=UPI00285E3E9A|nr:hypothetical protein [Caballeronia sp. LZ035]MDR5760144.1 hypothetical protein [Caballeronia sp. LZ035]
MSHTQPANTTTSNSPPLSNAEATQLLSRLDKDPSIPNDAANANSMAALQRDSLRGADPEAIGFEQRTTQASQEVDALRADQRDYYRGALAAGSTYYNAATTSDQRAQIASQVNTQVIDPIHTAYQQAMRDPNARVQMTFNKPFGSVYLGAGGQQQTDRLTRMGQQFNQAATPEERARIFGQAVDLRHAMQSQIGTFTDQERSRVQGQWQQADQEINQALRDATALRVADANSGFDNASSFQRLSSFITHGLNSERNAQEFQYRLTQTPDDFKALRDWSADATRKATWATSAIQSDPLRRTPELPPLPPDLTKTTTENARMGNFGGDMLYRYQTANRRILDAEEMYHAASQGGPIKYTYVDDHTPPLPLWQQQLKDGLGRFFVGMVPGVNLMTDYIVPAKSLPEWARQGIDFASGVVGSFVPAAKLPKFGSAGEMKPVGEFKPSTEFKPAAEIKPVAEITPAEAPATSTPAPDSTSGIPLVPKEYARAPSGKLAPDPNARGVYRDETGQQFIQQGGQTYPVSYNEDARHWQLQPREGWPNTRNMSIDEQGNWKVDLDKGLPGGAGVNTNSLAAGRAAFDLYEQGYYRQEIADKFFSVRRPAVDDALNRYVRQSGEVVPAQVTVDDIPTSRKSGEIYGRLTTGEPLQTVANDLTGGNQFEALRAAYRYARREHLRAENLPQNLPWRVQPQRAGVPPTETHPISFQNYTSILEGDQANIPTAQLSRETGMPPAQIDQIRQRPGYWSAQRQGWVALDGPPEYGPGFPRSGANLPPGPADAPQAGPSGVSRPATKPDQTVAQPGPSGVKRPATNPDQTVAQPGTSGADGQQAPKRSRTDAGSDEAASGTAQPPVAAPAAPPSWGSAQIKQFHQDHTKLGGPVSDSIDAWLDGHGAPPSSLQGELNQRGFTDITPDMVRTYLTGQGPELTSQQMQRISAFLSL